MKRLLAHFGSMYRRLLELRDTPHAIAGGVAIGIFWGFIPLLGVKTLFTLATAWLMRCSKIAAVIAVCLHDILWPVLPVLLRYQYVIGYWLLSHPHHLPPKLTLHHAKLGQMLAQIFHWKSFIEVGLPLLLGSLVFAIPATAIAYGLTFFIASRRDRKSLPPGA